MERKRSLDLWQDVELENGDPTEKKRLLLCESFSTVAGCDSAEAWRYLDENAWQMERALNAYFEPEVEGDDAPRRSAPGSRAAAGDLGGESKSSREAQETCGSRLQTNEAEPSRETSVDLTEEAAAEAPPAGTSLQPEDGSALSLVSWNIDGLDLNHLLERVKGVCSTLALYSPDVIFLQEVIPPYYSFLKRTASNYKIITGHKEGYFTAMMLKKSRVKIKSQEIIPFPNTKMMRNLLCVHVSVSGIDLCLMTSHLESTRAHAGERKNQLKTVLKKMQEASGSATVIFAGDTNLRDYEVTQCGGLPSNISDVWEFLGKPRHCQYTWDTQANSNLGIRAACKHRFDRVLFAAAADGSHFVPRSLDLLGLEKLDCGRFASDHWGLLCSFDVIL